MPAKKAYTVLHPSDKLEDMRKWLFIAMGMGVGAWFAFRPVPNTESILIPEAAPVATIVAEKPVAPAFPPLASSPGAQEQKSKSQVRESLMPEPVAAQLPKEEAPPGPETVGIILRDGKGALLKATQKDAARACLDRGMHLPSIRELARLGKFRGAKGIMHVSQFRREDELEGFELIPATNPNGAKDDFYYSPKGYVPAKGETSETIYWSSSICVGCVIGGNEEHHNNSSHSFYGNGEIHDHYDDLNFAIRCVGPQPH